MWAYRATGRLGIYHWPENSSVCDQGSWPSARLNGRLMGNRSKPDRLWGALFSLPPPVIHHISSWYWEILVPHWQEEEGQGSRQRRAAAGLRQGEPEQIVLYFLNTLNTRLAEWGVSCWKPVRCPDKQMQHGHVQDKSSAELAKRETWWT